LGSVIRPIAGVGRPASILENTNALVKRRALLPSILNDLLAVETDVKTEEVLYEDLYARIARMKKEIESAEDCLADRDFLQCAARLQHAGSETKFDNLHLNIMDSMSGTDS